MQHKYPFTMLHFTVEPEYIDVNVHPSKMELRFKDGEFLYKTVCQMIQGPCPAGELIPQVEITGRDEEKKEPGRSGAGNEASGKETSHRAPEPFEKKKGWPPWGSWRNGLPMGTGEPDWKPDSDAVRGLRPRSGTVRAARGKATGFSEQPVRQTEPSVRAAGLQGRGTEQPVQPAEVPSRPMEQPVRPAGEPSRQAEPSARQLSRRSIVQNLRPRPQSRWRCSMTACFQKKARSRHRLIGQVFDTYWLVEYNGSLYIIDQHAAHEKVLFEKTFRSLKSREYTSQLISPPIILTLSMQEEELLKKHMDVFTRVGFEIEPFGGNEYAVRAVPDNLFSLAKRSF